MSKIGLVINLFHKREGKIQSPKRYAAVLRTPGRDVAKETLDYVLLFPQGPRFELLIACGAANKLVRPLV